MNYYEELGLSPSAPAEQIRHAYRTLARLLHPDQFPDEDMKRLAELQMRRLNGIFAVLSDPEQRLRYQRQILTPLPAGRRLPERVVVPPPPERRWLRSLAFVGASWMAPAAVVLAGLGAVVYYAGGGRETLLTPAAAEPAPVAATLLAQPDSEDPIAVSAPQPEPPVPTAGHLKVFEQPPLRKSTLAEEPLLPEPPAAARSAAPEPRPVNTPAGLDPARGKTLVPHPSRFAGNWYYVPAPHLSAAKGMYLPQYIELRLAEEAGVVRGRYRAVYRVTDQAISPEVSFQFEGAGSSPLARFTWSGPGEARGQVTLRLLSPDFLEVSWLASQLSADLGLASGTAQLVRQREP